MRTEQVRWSKEKGWLPKAPGLMDIDPKLVLVFAGRGVLEDSTHFDEIRRAFPRAQIAGCSTSGEIFDIEVTDDDLTVTAVEFDTTTTAQASLRIGSASESFEVGKKIVEALPSEGLRHILMFSVGTNINGSDLVKGAMTSVPEGVTITGGLAGDGARFERTFTVSNDGAFEDRVVAIGLYGTEIEVGYASVGGWDTFGPERLVTKSKGNVLYELDGKSALKLYKTYLGEHAEGLPASGLLFPLSIRSEGHPSALVRTILAVNEEDQSITFAGDIPERSYAQMMQANFDRLVQGAVDAAKNTQSAEHGSTELALLISCVGRKLVLKQRVEEEVEGVREIFGQRAILTGFYSYGEISPFTLNVGCELHNQTMTITTFRERTKSSEA
jgi:hypothetical protein